MFEDWKCVHSAKDTSSSAGKVNQGGEIESKGEREREREHRQRKERLLES